MTDLDNNRFKDFSTMGMEQTFFGYGNSKVDTAETCNKKGNLSTLNCRKVLLAEKREIHPWLKW